MTTDGRMGRPDVYFMPIRGDTGGKVNISGGDIIGHCEKKNYMNMCRILNGYRDTAV
jgi:hypothetical protein